jgi:hypothetical protein
MSDSDTKTYHIRVQANRAYTYGLGEEIITGVHLFKAGHYDLDQEQIERAIKDTGRSLIALRLLRKEPND